MMDNMSTTWLTELDLIRLSRLVQELRSRYLQAPADNLVKILDSARVVRSEEIPAHVVTMNSQVVIEEVRTGELRDMTLVYPADADPSQRKLSVLSPTGIALLGLGVGDETDLRTPFGEKLRVRIIRILYQPEAEGHMTV